jgi:tight adherence protein B
MTQETIIFFIIGSIFAMILGGAGIIGLTMVIRPRILLRQRMNQIGVIGTGAAAGSEKTESRRQKRIQDRIKQLEQKGKKKGRSEALRSEIIQAGLDISVQTYFIISLCVGVILTFFYLMAGMPLMGAIAAFLIGAFGLPKFALKNMASRRQKKFTANFADATDLIVRGIRSGLPVNECFRIVAREFEAPLGEEFHQLVEGQNLGMTMEDLLDRGLERIPTSEYKFFAIVTQIQRQTGGNLGDTLSNLSSILRERKKLRDKVQALSSEAKASAMIIGSLPFFVSAFLMVINPDYLMKLFTETTGHYILAGDAFWMGSGIMVMRNMINFKI